MQHKDKEKRKSDMAFLKHIVRTNGPCGYVEGQRLYHIVRAYPLELWYISYELNKGYLKPGHVKLILEHISKLNPALN